MTDIAAPPSPSHAYLANIARKRTIITCASPSCSNLFAPHRAGCDYCHKSCAKHHATRIAAPIVSCRAPGCCNLFLKINARKLYCGQQCAHFGTQISRAVKEYGVTPETYAGVLTAACEICGGDNGGRILCVDHDHATGAIRGFLCHRCNAGLGMYDDDLALIVAAADYLRRTT